MFDTRWRMVVRDARRHRARTLLVVVAVALGLIGAGAVLDAWALVRTATQTVYGASHPVAATLQVVPLDAAFVARVQQMPGIRAVRLRRTLSATLQTVGERKSVVLHAVDDVTRPDIGRLQNVEGAWPPAPGEVIIERSSLGYSGAAVGQDVLLAVPGTAPIALKVGGLVRDVSVAPGWMEHVVYGYVSLATLRSLGTPPTFDELQFTVTDPAPSQATVRQLAWRVKTLAEAQGRRVGRIDVPMPGQHIHAAQMESLTIVQGAFGVLTLMVCASLMVNLISAMLAGRRRELGVMKALGASEGQLAAQFLLFAAGLGVLAVSVALPLAAWLGRLYGDFQAEMLNFPLDQCAIPVWALLVQVAVGIALPVLAAAWPVATACRQPVADILRHTGLPASTSGNRTRRWLQGLPLARPQLLSLHNAFRQRSRCWLSLLALAAAGATFVGAGNLSVAVKHSVDRLFDAQRYDVNLRMTTPMPARDLVAAAVAVPGVAVAEAWGRATAALAHDDGTAGNAFDVLAVPVRSRVLVPMLRDGRWLRDGEVDGIVIGSALLKSNPGLQLGQPVQLQVEGRPASFQLIGIVDSGPDAIAYTAQTARADWQGDTLASLLLVQARDRSTDGQRELIRRLRTALASRGAEVRAARLQSDARQGVEDHLQMVVSFLGVMGWVMIVVGGIGLATTMSVAVLERQREIGVLRAIGARSSTILGMVQLEGMVMALLGWLLALPLSVPVSVVLGQAFGRVMFAVPTALTPEPGGVLRWFALVTGVSVLACMWPAWQAMRMPVARALQYE
ncbi:putative ABC transport system permease protein [Actimicrobium sp. GrIS 1.19]|uniref:ABC transporter permease n=1 Tax=Actimicrobium sp. GrIS 1.19 TaxID=3071708 RepID=UPI002DF7E72D|nr:putative ABC transport system permease protein [Actimicrobium sp. GrIS 1.19]